MRMIRAAVRHKTPCWKNGSVLGAWSHYSLEEGSLVVKSGVQTKQEEGGDHYKPSILLQRY